MQQKVIKRAAPQLGNTNKLVYDFFPPFEYYFNAKYEIKQKAKKTHTQKKRKKEKNDQKRNKLFFDTFV